MSAGKQFDRIAVAVTALMLVLTLLFMNGGAFGLQVMAHTMGYESRLFDNTRVHTIDIVMDDWDDFIANATSEEYYAANVVIDGESYKNVGIRAKGNTSLSTVASLGSERYSLKIEFDHYDSTKSYYGLDKLSLNNLIQDATMMKDYLTYTMMQAFGVSSSLCSYVYITVNGEDWGLYLAVEGVEEAFLERNYGADYGELYKPDSMSFGGGRGNGKDFNMDEFDFASAESQPDESFQPPSMPEEMELPEDFDPTQGGDMGGGMGSSDVKLQYIDDDPDSYANIWDNAKTDITDSDKTRLIDSLEKLSSCEDLEAVVDVEEVLRYFVVHNFVCNGDSYTGTMVHNYYLYEKDGQLSMIPWDYNLAFGTFSGGDADSAVNTPIDSPVSGGSGEDRPMWYWILSEEAYTDLYHQYFAEFLSTVDIQQIIDDAYNLIKSYVEQDPTAFYPYEEFEAGVEALREFCTLRSESISQQLESGETTEDMGYVDGSNLNLSDMGTMNNGQGGMDGGMPDRTAPTGEDATAASAQPGEMGEAPFGRLEDMEPENLSEGETGEQQEVEQPPDNTGGSTQDRPSGGQMPGGSFDGSAMASTGNETGWIWIAASAAILLLGLAVAFKFRR